MSATIADKLFLDRFTVDETPHLEIVNPGVCITDCVNRPCLHICPANVYRLENDRISVNYEGCLECGSCRIACPCLNIKWRFPTGGFGIRHKFG